MKIVAKLYGGPHDGMERRIQTVTPFISIPTPYSVHAYRYNLKCLMTDTESRTERPRYEYGGKYNRFTGIQVT
jgi:hypothetical protein